jgi:hypothetical protein
VGLRDGEVLVVTWIRNHRQTPFRGRTRRGAWEVEALPRLVPADRNSPSHLQVDVVLVELRRLRILRPGAVERVEVEARGPGLDELCGRDPLAEHDRRPVERQVVVDELPEVGKAGRDARL